MSHPWHCLIGYMSKWIACSQWLLVPNISFQSWFLIIWICIGPEKSQVGWPLHSAYVACINNLTTSRVEPLKEFRILARNDWTKWLITKNMWMKTVVRWTPGVPFYSCRDFRYTPVNPFVLCKLPFDSSFAVLVPTACQVRQRQKIKASRKSAGIKRGKEGGAAILQVLFVSWWGWWMCNQAESTMKSPLCRESRAAAP